MRAISTEPTPQEMYEQEQSGEIDLNIIQCHPPNFTKIANKFPGVHGEGVIFAYGDTIYNPSGVDIPASSMDHEAVHCIRQIEIGVEHWWHMYLTDDKFRYDEEVLAHQAEWKNIREDFSMTRQQRRYLLKQIAKRLSGPLYGRAVSFEKANRDIKNV